MTPNYWDLHRRCCQDPTCFFLPGGLSKSCAGISTPRDLSSFPQSVVALMGQEINMSLARAHKAQEWVYECPSPLPFKWTNSKACIGHCFPGFPRGINSQLPTEAAGFVTLMLLAVFCRPYELSSSLQVSLRFPKPLALKSLSQGLFLGNPNKRQRAVGPTLYKAWEDPASRHSGTYNCL